jgi:signal transduction histidine kinase
VFFNLIHNAVKFTPKEGTIQVLTEVLDQKVFIAIKDTGIGIEPENQARIFEKFYRIRLVEADIVDGNGLGLSMARAIARAHKGDITFESELGTGSVFTVSLPLLLN